MAHSVPTRMKRSGLVEETDGGALGLQSSVPRGMRVVRRRTAPPLRRIALECTLLWLQLAHGEARAEIVMSLAADSLRMTASKI